MKIYRCLIGVLAALFFVACDEQNVPSVEDLLSAKDTTQVETEGLTIMPPRFSEDYKTLVLLAKLNRGLGAYDLTDTTKVLATAPQTYKLEGGVELKDHNPLILKSISNIGKDEVAALGLKLMVLVDLSLPQDIVEKEQMAVREIKTLFDRKNLYVAFMQGNNVSESYEATDYVLDNYFQQQDPSYTYLYRSVKLKMEEMVDDTTSAFSDARRKVMIVLSGGKTYIDDTPIDPLHFELQKQLTDKAQQAAGKMQMYYANFSDSLSVSGGYEANIMQFMCQDLEGLYQNRFDWVAIENDMVHDFKLNYVNYRFVFEVPDKKVYRGFRNIIKVNFVDKATNKEIVSGSTSYHLGSFYDPLIVNGNTLFDVIMQGLLMTLALILLIYVIMQFLVPYVRYRLFKRKYVTVYGGKQMSFNGMMVAESCYFCKAPFAEGEEIVTKCQHTMHKECWDENEYHCTEYGRNCKHGSHYYNEVNLFDTHNPPFYMKWVLMAICAGFVSWVIYICQHDHFTANMIKQIVLALNGLESDTPEAEQYLNQYGVHLNNLPVFGMIISFFTTLFLSFLTVRRRQWSVRLTEMLVRAVVAGILGYLCFLLDCVISIVLGLESNAMLIDWIPWTLMSWAIMFAVTVDTRIKLRKLFLLIACGIGILSMNVWATIFMKSMIDFRVSLLMSYVFYAVCVALCIARMAPKSERYFLRVEGAIKEMDVALYKWMRSSPSMIVTIGKSVDCSIQLSWDINGKVAPLQAEIRRRHGSLRLYAIEEGVTVDHGKPLGIGDDIWLYHGRSFTIGNTTFTYIEKDL